jgi:hypothetical protein
VCDPSLGLDFLKEIKVHYDMNYEKKDPKDNVRSGFMIGGFRV